jgi:hypothetical protein
MVDFTPLFVLAACLILVALWQEYQTQPSRARWFKWLTGAAVFYSLTLNLAFVTPRLSIVRQLLSSYPRSR